MNRERERDRDWEQGGAAPALLLACVVLLGLGSWWLLERRESAAGGAAPGAGAASGQQTAPLVPGAVAPEAVAILDAIQQLEAARDPKCHSTACRFENFVFGTPLTDGARDAKAELQKEVIHDVWRQASAAAGQAGARQVDAARVAPFLDDLFRIEELANEEFQVTFPAHRPIVLSHVRARQYGSIAYSLRAILGLQQELLLEPGELLLPLERAAVDRLRESIDTLTLCALALADEQARAASLAEIPADGLRAAWRRLIPESAVAARDAGASGAASGAAAAGFDLLFAMVQEKKAAFKAYNLNPDERAFYSNVERFYALYPPPPMDQGGLEVISFFTELVTRFSVELLMESRAVAGAAGHPLIRSSDAARAMEKLAPHQIDHFEDSHFFFHLPRERRVALEAYDTDSFRDFGMHWILFDRALRQLPDKDLPADPFAAEVMTEAISQYGVLLLRVAGSIAKERRADPYFREADLTAARERIQEAARAHHAAPERGPESGAIRSSGLVFAAAAADHFFADATLRSGIEFEHRSSAWLSEFRRMYPANPPTFSGGGVAAGDVDRDGDPDVLLLSALGHGLFLNDGNGRFTDVGETSGLRVPRADGNFGEPRQPLLADFDNDGQLDVLITYANDPHQVFRNLGGARFADVTAAAGLGGTGLVGGPATTFDFDGDGLLDIYICYFGDYLNGALPKANRSNRNALPNALFRNLGGFRFADVTKGSGTDDRGWAQAVSHTDFDGDGRQDIVVANDYGANALLRNLGDGRFADEARALGITKAYHSMNVGFADLNQDDRPEIYISNIATMVKDNKYVLPDVNTPLIFEPKAMANMLVQEANMLYVSLTDDGRLAGYEVSPDVERGKTSTGWAWDAQFFDHDLDGDDDLYVLNGTNDYAFFYAVTPVEGQDGDVSHLYLDYARQSNVFFVNEDGKLKNLSDQSGADFLGNSRSAAYLDMDGDGDLDVVINNFHAPAVVLENRAGGAGRNWLKVMLVGDPQRGTNRDAIGARLIVTGAGGLRVWREVHGGSGYLSMNPTEQHFGLGANTSVDLEIRWPNGEVQRLAGLAAGRAYTIVQGDPGPPAAR